MLLILLRVVDFGGEGGNDTVSKSKIIYQLAANGILPLPPGSEAHELPALTNVDRMI
jgi:hypothetical protein